MILSQDLQPGDQFVDEKTGRVAYTIVKPVLAPWEDEVSFIVTPSSDESGNKRTWRRGYETPLVRP